MKRIIFYACVAAAAIFPFVGNAKDAPAPAGGQKPQIENFGNWDVRCFPVKSLSPCDAFFSTIRKKTRQRVSSVSVAYIPSKNQFVMRIAVPAGISLANGVVIAAGSYTSAKLPFRRCDRGGCYVEMVVGNDMINALKNAGNAKAHLNVATLRGQRLGLPLSLNGFGQVLDQMVSEARAKASNP